VDPYPTPKFVHDSAKLQGLIAEETRRKTYLFWLAVLVAALAVYYWIMRQSQLALAWRDSDSRWSRLTLQKAVSAFGVLDSILYWISYPFYSDGLDHLRSLAAPLFAVYDQNDADFRRTREQAVSILLNKRDLERRIFKADVIRSVPPSEARRLLAVGCENVVYSSKQNLRTATFDIPVTFATMVETSVRFVVHSALWAVQTAQSPGAKIRVWFSRAMLRLSSGSLKLKNQVENFRN
jgi:hypothetical protein